MEPFGMEIHLAFGDDKSLRCRSLNIQQMRKGCLCLKLIELQCSHLSQRRTCKLGRDWWCDNYAGIILRVIANFRIENGLRTLASIDMLWKQGCGTIKVPLCCTCITKCLKLTGTDIWDNVRVVDLSFEESDLRVPQILLLLLWLKQAPLSSVN